ncbi:MAG TPA: hypothetical protein VFB45_24430 [Pseudolabrys sp.]|nr:hypothetical protein [Pseudolabrys sp.]
MRRDLRAPIVSAVLILTGTSVTAATRVMDPETPSARSEARVQSGQIPGIGWKTADQVPVWKTIRLGGYGSVNALREALDSEGCVPGGLAAGDRRRVVRTASRPTHGPDCRLGESAAELIGRPAFHLSRAKDAVDLVILPATALGFAAGDSVPLETLYDRAEMLGFALCPAEIGALLRLQYLEQPSGEFLHVAMQPIATYLGEPTDFTVGNDNSGLLLLGGEARPDTAVPAVTRFVFVKPRPWVQR